MTNISRIYRDRFHRTGLERRDRVWKVLCDAYFAREIPPGSTVLELACGYGEFINNITAKHKLAVDINPDAALHLAPNIQFCSTAATNLASIATDAVDIVFTSNFLEHLGSKAECDDVLAEALRVLKPGGKFIAMGPNIRYAHREYWDFYDHTLALSDRSLAEGLRLAGFHIAKIIPRFLPYTMDKRAPTPDILVRAYLALPFAWRFFGKQFLVTAIKP